MNKIQNQTRIKQKTYQNSELQLNRMKKQQTANKTRTEQNLAQKKLGQNNNMNRIQNQIKT